MRKCFIRNEYQLCNGQRNRKGTIKYSCWGCQYLYVSNRERIKPRGGR